MHEIHASNRDEDFAALKQHIDDLTGEKFSLQRALEASRALAESLTVENSYLTDSFNQQAVLEISPPFLDDFLPLAPLPVSLRSTSGHRIGTTITTSQPAIDSGPTPAPAQPQ